MNTFNATGLIVGLVAIALSIMITLGVAMTIVELFKPLMRAIG
jgi:hypothetical protein